MSIHAAQQSPASAGDSVAPGGSSLRGSHRLHAISVCERYWTLRYYFYYLARYDKPYRLRGTLLHTAYQYYYASLMAEPPPWYHNQSLEERLQQQVMAAPPSMRVAMLYDTAANLRAFMHRFQDDAREIIPRYLEHEFKVRLGDMDPGGPWPELDDELVTSRCDFAYSPVDAPETLWLLDYKTLGWSKTDPQTGLLQSWNPKGRWRLSWQSLINLHAARAEHPDVRGFIILRATRQEPWDFDRHPLNIPKLPYQEAASTCRHAIKRENELTARLERGEKPIPQYGSCHGEYGSCDYIEYCTAATERDRQAVLEEDFVQPSSDAIARARSALKIVR